MATLREELEAFANETVFDPIAGLEERLAQRFPDRATKVECVFAEGETLEKVLLTVDDVTVSISNVAVDKLVQE